MHMCMVRELIEVTSFCLKPDHQCDTNLRAEVCLSVLTIDSAIENNAIVVAMCMPTCYAWK